jgi:glycolate oxidase FAD binding subunit
MAQHEALQRLNEWGGQPLPISASAWHDGMLTLRLSGAAAAVKAAASKLGGEVIDDGAAFWLALREQTLAFFGGAKDLWRLSLPPQAPQIVLGGQQLIEWGGAQRWLRTSSDAASDAVVIRASVAAAGGHACLFRGGDKHVGVFQPLAPAVARIHRHLKNAFDPAGIFNPGRMYPGL